MKITLWSDGKVYLELDDGSRQFVCPVWDCPPTSPPSFRVALNELLEAWLRSLPTCES